MVCIYQIMIIAYEIKDDTTIHVLYDIKSVIVNEKKKFLF